MKELDNETDTHVESTTLTHAIRMALKIRQGDEGTSSTLFNVILDIVIKHNTQTQKGYKLSPTKSK